MATRPLENGSWGFDSICFVCEPTNEAGLRIPFVHDTDAVRASFRSGAQALDALGTESTGDDASYVGRAGG